MQVYGQEGASWGQEGGKYSADCGAPSLDGSELETPEEVIAALEATVRGWNRAPTRFVWGGKRKLRRERAKARRLGGSGAMVDPKYLKAYKHNK